MFVSLFPSFPAGHSGKRVEILGSNPARTRKCKSKPGAYRTLIRSHKTLKVEVVILNAFLM